MGVSAWIWLAIFIIGFLLGYPFGFSMFISSVAYIILERIDLTTVLDVMVIQFETNFVLLAVPLFLFSANLMNASSLTDRLFNFASAVVGPLRGGLAHVNIVNSMIFAGMSGSEIADVAGPGAMEVRAMEKAGFDKPFSCAVSAASATLGPIIPPSIPMVIYAMISGSSVGYLFLGGLLPGVILASCLMLWVFVISGKRKYPVGRWSKPKEFLGILARSFPILMAPVILLLGIYTGIFTPTEAAAVVCVYALILSLLAYRTVNLKGLFKIILQSVCAAGYTSFTIGGAFLFGYVLAREEIPGKVAQLFLSLGLTDSAALTLLSINVLFLVLGCFIDVSASLLIVVPIILPVVKAAGIDLVHFGVVVVLNLMIGLSTPPYGEAGFIIARVTDTPLGAVFRELIKFIVFMIVALAIISVFPDTVLLIPRLAGYRG
ncbi:MAG TPA: TRAP transporter large permease [Spirochaetales bacterium]|nr:TRAP transporter large permease [Spirochaetales bacterium]HRY55690.1 TRAP transporter large permease [Spirochaetia bacterium]HRZ65433.1 TRAP transporter large permease [Spirochaetia bacterium]